MEIFNSIQNNVSYFQKIKNATTQNKCTGVCGLGLGEKVLSLASLHGKVIFIAGDSIELLGVREGLNSLGIKCAQVVADLSAPTIGKHSVVKNDSVKEIYDFAFGDARVLLLSSENLLVKYAKKPNKDNFIEFEKNKDYNLNDIMAKLLNIGYSRVDKVESVGEFAVRGDILDIYSAGVTTPIRLDFFGDTLEKIYTFDFAEMQKVDEFERINICPSTLFVLGEQETGVIAQKIKESVRASRAQGDVLLKQHALATFVEEGLKDKTISPDTDFLLPFFENHYSILDLFDNAVVVVSEPKKIADSVCEEYKSCESAIRAHIEAGELLNEHLNYFFDKNVALNFEPNLIFSNFEKTIFNTCENINARTIGSFNYCFDYKKLVNDILIYEKSRYKILLFAGSEDSKNSLTDYLAKNGIVTSEDFDFDSAKAQVVVKSDYFPISASFLDGGIIIIGSDDLIKKSKTQVKNLTNKNKKKVFYLPKVGDYVVHEIHGIGKCVALSKMNLNGNEKEYFVLEYLGGDKLYLPSEQASSISALLGAGENPKLNKIGGQQFAKIKQRVKESVGKLAIDLIKIYAEREKSKGVVYDTDNYLYDEFENSFEFEETPDQLSAIADIKKDMSSSKIMDRLICGDVGYGKTEVALRAIYMAILNGKQVAFLCPTTILSQQHYITAQKRFSGFMVNVQVLNRFKSKKEQDKILEDVALGKVDLLIGTHRLLSRDVNFKNLSLLVLDEEQRFGVGDKEKIKDLKKDIDVLTLSATPIPRTLNMAMTGIRDISIIETPPKERIAVKTYVAQESDTLILEACKRELALGGQVLYVFNRVEHIYDQAKRLKELLPDARVGVAHGQMPENLLEQTIMDLYNKKFDILVATTLIESGIDLPLANTLIVINADKLGLAELYQLRGRIGRSDRTAFAYFTYNPSKVLTEDAYKRLDAILEYTELGSGFKIAMRDLQIRGAGNVLGKEQHGHLEKVGYDLYCKLLDSAVKELKGEKVAHTQPIKLDISISANLPNYYVASEDERIKLYSNISLIASQQEYLGQYEKLKENYGQPPKEAENLLKIAYLKNLGATLGIKRILITLSAVNIYLYKTEELVPKAISQAMAEVDNCTLKFEDSAVLSFDFLSGTPVETRLDFILNFLKKSKEFDS